MAVALVVVVVAAVLGHGTAVVLGDVRCASLTSGITCTDTVTGAGFRASRTSALLWR